MWPAIRNIASAMENSFLINNLTFEPANCLFFIVIRFGFLMVVQSCRCKLFGLYECIWKQVKTAGTSALCSGFARR